MSTESNTRHLLACPHCRSTDVTRSRTRGFLERAARVFGLRPFRCRDCYDRFFSFGDPLRREAALQAHESGDGVSRGAKVQT
jgi:hypothetical protein